MLALGNRQGELRGVLGQLLEKSSQGQIKFGPEPDNREQLPEEANNEQVENQELDQQLLTGEANAEKTDQQVNLVGDRMARVRQRLAMNDDPGKTTQIIEDRIITDLDILVDQARKQEAADAQQPAQTRPATTAAAGQARRSAGPEPGPATATKPRQHTGAKKHA